MTSEEAIARIKNHKIAHKMNEPRAIYISEALDMAIQALEQEPKTGHWITLKDEYGDVHEAICSNCGSNGNHKWTYCPKCGIKMQDENIVIKALGQYPKIGYWVRRNSFLVPYKCSECNYESERYDNYCPNCGTKMVEPQERSE